jgi:tRNA (adenine57-N1/adenine58-N1)-methyltransferase
MIGHTGFLVTARRLADGVRPPARRRRPAKGAQPEAPQTEAPQTEAPQTEPAQTELAETDAGHPGTAQATPLD